MNTEYDSRLSSPEQINSSQNNSISRNIEYRKLETNSMEEVNPIHSSTSDEIKTVPTNHNHVEIAITPPEKCEEDVPYLRNDKVGSLEHSPIPNSLKARISEKQQQQKIEEKKEEMSTPSKPNLSVDISKGELLVFRR